MRRLKKDRPLAAKNGLEENLRTSAVTFGGQKMARKKIYGRVQWPLAAKHGSEENLRTSAVTFGGQKWLGRKFTDECSDVILRFCACLPPSPQ